MASTTVDTRTPDPQARLERLRAELDLIDQRLLKLIQQRLDCCCRIGALKRDAAIPMMQPQRVGLVHQRAQEFSQRNGINALFLRQLYDLIIQETCRLEDAVIAHGAARADAIPPAA